MIIGWHTVEARKVRKGDTVLVDGKRCVVVYAKAERAARGTCTLQVQYPGAPYPELPFDMRNWEFVDVAVQDER